MNSQVFQAALAATARVACCAVLVSCQKPVKAPVEPPPLMEHPAQQEEKPVVSQESIAPLEPALPQPSTDFETCTPTIEQFVETKPTPDQKTPNAVLDCCTLQGNEVDDKQGLAWENRSDCCHFLNWQGPFACTPWGPPTPPHMSSTQLV